VSLEISVPEIMEHTCGALFEIKLEIWISTLALLPAQIAPYKLHVPHRKLERKFQIVLFARNGSNRAEK
jgi:hypothetical protein